MAKSQRHEATSSLTLTGGRPKSLAKLAVLFDTVSDLVD